MNQCVTLGSLLSRIQYIRALLVINNPLPFFSPLDKEATIFDIEMDNVFGFVIKQIDENLPLIEHDFFTLPYYDLGEGYNLFGELMMEA